MKVAMYYHNRDVRIEEIPKPQIGPGEFLMQMMACGICGSDVLEWYRLKRAPLVLGHEATGVIAEVGEGVKNYKVGQRVFVSHHVPCNSCCYCLSGNHTVCQTLHTTNYFPGGFSEYICVPKINVERGTFLLPEEISFVEGTFIEPLACVLRSQRMSEVKREDAILILGAGISGLLHLLAAKAQKVKRVIVTDINEYRLKLAKRLGADAVIDAREDVVSRLRQNNEDRLADLVIVSTGAPAAFLQAIKSVERAGRLLFFAATQPGVDVPIPVSDFWRKSIKIIHSYGASPQDTIEAITWLKEKRIPVEPLISHRLSLSDAGLGFRLVAEAKECVKWCSPGNKKGAPGL
ncbi:MAG: alcohol dehydrogenase catalytic domain-containing protein [Candidatus Omnitrophica bacterium]|nr:alcohol dehydrogenase catalytic domain-containing protein [Candidatus Omnitrophota bacterium]